MPLEKLTADELDVYGSEYVSFLKGLRPGEGARADVKSEGVTKFTLKKRLSHAADVAGVRIKFRRSDPNTVILVRADGAAKAPRAPRAAKAKK